MKKVLVLLIFLAASVVFATPSIKYYGGGQNYTDNFDNRITNTPLDPVKGGLIQVSVVDINSADINVLYTVPIKVIAAPGSGKLIDVIDCVLICNYGSAFTAGSATNLALKYNTASPGVALTGTVAFTGLMTASVDTEAKLLPVAVAATAATAFDNNDVCLTLVGGAPGQAGTSTMRVITTYRVHSSGLKD